MVSNINQALMRWVVSDCAPKDLALKQSEHRGKKRKENYEDALALQPLAFGAISINPLTFSRTFLLTLRRVVCFHFDRVLLPYHTN